MENSNGKYRHAIFIGPRRLGKDYMAWAYAIRHALRKPTSVLYLLPTYSQCKAVIWDAIANDGTRFLDQIPPEVVLSMNASDMKVTLKNGSIIQLRGADNYDRSIVGSNASLIIFSEYAVCDPRAYEFASPIVAANGGSLVFLSTPRGRNHLYTLWKQAQDWPDWFCYKLTLNDTKHISDEELAKERLKHSQEFIAQEYYCFPAGQEVLTVNETKPIESVKKDDLVVSHSGRLRKVIDTISREYEGELIEISSFGSGENIVCTPNHPIRVYHRSIQTYEWKEAQHITEEDRLVFPKMTLGEYPIISYELCMLLAWYITEGSGYANAAQFTVKESESHVIVGYLKSLNMPYLVIENGPVVNVQVNSVQLADFFKAACGLMAYNKRIPFHLISGHEEDFFHELIKGDGCYNISKNYETYRFTTISKTLAYQVQLLANSLNLGYACGISIREAHEGVILGREVHCKESYALSIAFPGVKSTTDAKLIRAKNCIAAKIKSIDRKYYKGLVYNLSVQYDESYLVNGRAVHNCSFDRGIEGSFYAKYITAMVNDGRIGRVPYDPSLPVSTAWDLGFNDQTVILLYQITKTSTVQIIDCYSNTNQPLGHYIKWLKDQPYIYGKHFGPHDLEIHDYQTGHTRIEMARQLGLNFETRERSGKLCSATPKVSVADGIEKCMTSFSRVYIDEGKCRKLITALESYHREWDDDRKVYKQQPYHSADSDWADSFRYLCLTVDMNTQGMTVEDAHKGYRETVWGNDMNTPLENPLAGDTRVNPFSEASRRFF